MQKTRRVRDYMATDLLTLTPDTNIFDAVDFLVDNHISGAPVLNDEGRLIGVLSEKDCLRTLAKGGVEGLSDGVVGDYMTRDPEVLTPDMDVYFATGRFLGRPFRRFPVVEAGRLVGQISRRDVLRAIQAVARLRGRPPEGGE